MAHLFQPLSTSFLGFDTFFNDIDRLLGAGGNGQTTGFPPQNLYKEENGDYVIEMAVAGFKKADVKIEFNERTHVLTVTGDNTPAQTGEAHVVGKESDKREVVTQEFSRQTLQQRIANRKFTRSWTIADDLFVGTASLEDGLLTIRLVKSFQSDNVLQIPIR